MAHTLIGRRGLLHTAGAATALITAPRLARALARDITLQLWGATWTGSMRKVAQEFEARPGNKVTAVTQATSGEGLVKIQSMRQQPSIDVRFVTSSVAERAKTDGDLFRILPYDALPAAKAIEPGARGSHWAGVYFYQLGIVWRPDMVEKPITAWQDLGIRASAKSSACR